MDGAEPELFWDSTYAICLALMQHYPNIEPVGVGIWELAELVESLPNFMDDPAMVTERILLDIQSTWYEEAASL